jgi:SAM-dependent methyltransferase
MSFSKEWDERFKANTHLCIWPWSDLITYVMRYSRPAGAEYNVLELGCGAGGANIPFFLSLGVRYYSIEGSPTAVERLSQKFPNLKNNIVVGDFTNDIPFKMQFDLIVDRGSLTHNTTVTIKKGLTMVYDKLKTGGKYIGIDWFSTMHSDYTNGLAVEGDIYTIMDIQTGRLAHTGNVHFSDKQHLLDLFADFKIAIMEHKIIHREIPEDDFVIAFWNLVVQKV